MWPHQNFGMLRQGPAGSASLPPGAAALALPVAPDPVHPLSDE